MNRLNGGRGGFRLPTAVAPIADESLASLLVRNAAASRFRNPLRVLSRIAIRSRSIAELLLNPPSPEVVDSIATLLGVDTAVLRRMAPWGWTPDTGSVLGVPVPNQFLRLTSRRACPGCLQDSLHHRAWWDVAALTSCPAHRRPLLDRCPGCGGLLRWMDYRFFRCGGAACRFDLRTAVHDGPPVDWSHVSGLLGMLTADPPACLPGNGLTFGQALEAAYVVGQVLHVDRMPKRRSTFLRKGAGDVAIVMEAGWFALDNWPVNFEKALSMMRERAKHRGGRHGLRREFGKLPRWFATAGSAPWAAPLRDAFAAYVAKQDDLRTKKASRKKLGLPQEAGQRTLTQREAARLLGLTRAKMEALAEHRGLYVVRSSGTGAPSLLRADLVERLRAQDEARLPKGDAADVLGVGRTVVLDLLDRGLLHDVPMEERIDYRRSIPRQDLDDLIQRMRDRLVPAPDTLRLVPLTTAGRTRCSIADLVEAVLAHRLSPRGIVPGEVGIGALMFDQDEVGAAVRVPQPTLSVNEAAAELRVDEKNLRVWIASGRLKTLRGSGPGQRGMRITHEELEKFRATYVTVTEISKLVGIRSWTVSQRMLALGIIQMSPQAKTALYPREVLTEELVRQIGSE